MAGLIALLGVGFFVWLNTRSERKNSRHLYDFFDRSGDDEED